MKRFGSLILTVSIVVALVLSAAVVFAADSGGYGSSSSSSSSGYGAPAKPAASSGYGSAPAKPAASGGYGAPAKPAASSGYGSAPAKPATSGGYGAPAKPAASSGYGSAPAKPAASGGYGAPAPTKPAASSGYGSAPAKPAKATEKAAPAATEAKPAASGYGSTPAQPATQEAQPAATQEAQPAPQAEAAPEQPQGPGSAGIMFIATGLLTGIALGWTLQRGRFCMNSAFRDTIFIKDYTFMRAYILALIVAIVGANALNDAGMINLGAQPFWPFAHIIGGYIFGLGIVLAGGCGSGIWYRCGEGLLASWVAVFGFFVGIATTKAGILKPIYDASRSVTLLADKPRLWQLIGQSMPIKWGVIVVLAIIGWFFIKGSDPFKPGKQKGYYWSFTGLLIGIIAVLAFWLAAVFGGGFARGLSFTTPTIELFDTVTKANADASGTIFPIRTLFGYIYTTWGVFFIIGVPLGAYLSARGLNEFSWKVPPAKELLTVLGGSLMMGVGATMALGCNMGQGITGVATLSVGSIMATIAIILGNWTMVYFKFIKPMQDLDDEDV